MPRILVIDDDDDVRRTIGIILECSGYALAYARDGEDGIRVLGESCPDLVITDIIMPNKEGIETIREIRRRDVSTPILAVSGGGRTGSTSFLHMAREFGANDVLPKPFSASELVATVRHLIAAASNGP